MYYNSLGVTAGSLARFSLPVKTPSTSSCFTFYYSMVSNGQLKVSMHVQNISKRMRTTIMIALLESVAHQTSVEILPTWQLAMFVTNLCKDKNLALCLEFNSVDNSNYFVTVRG